MSPLLQNFNDTIFCSIFSKWDLSAYKLIVAMFTRKRSEKLNRKKWDLDKKDNCISSEYFKAAFSAK